MRFPTTEVDAPAKPEAKTRAASPSQGVQAFIRWFDSCGRFIYVSRAEAATVWVGRGIKTLDAAPAGAAEALAGWVAAEPQKDRTYGSYGTKCVLCGDTNHFSGACYGGTL